MYAITVNTNEWSKYSSYEKPLAHSKNLDTILIPALYTRRATLRYPTSDGMSLYNFKNPPFHAITAERPIPPAAPNISHHHLYVSIFINLSPIPSVLVHRSAIHIPRPNSQRYCRKKLPHGRSSSNPNSPTKVLHSRLTTSKSCPPQAVRKP